LAWPDETTQDVEQHKMCIFLTQDRPWTAFYVLIVGYVRLRLYILVGTYTYSLTHA